MCWLKSIWVWEIYGRKLLRLAFAKKKIIKTCQAKKKKKLLLRLEGPPNLLREYMIEYYFYSYNLSNIISINER